MMPAYVAMFKWLAASAACVATGLLAWALLTAALRRWPALLPRRALWLAAQGVTAGAALLAFVPHAAQLGIAPTVTLSEPAAVARQPSIRTVTPGGTPLSAASPSSTSPSSASAGERSDDTGDTNDIKPPPPALILAALWSLIYACGLARALLRLLQARRLWRQLLASADRLSPQDLLAHGAFSASQLADIARHRLAVMETGAAISPMLVGVRRPLLLLPRHLRDFSAEQQHMIIAHELHHWRARDPLCLGISTVLQTVFWFNPALRWMHARMEWALELTCDQQVLAGRPQQQRKQYAQALLLQWKTQTATLPAAGVAFGGIDGATAAARIRHMQQSALPALSRAAVCGVSVSLAALLAAGVMLQPVLAVTSPQPAAIVVQTAPFADSGETAWRYPLDKMHVSGFFGVTRTVSVRPHTGIDIAAPVNTPVHASAAGVVIAAGPLAENDGRYGTTVIVDHGTQRSLYAHLSSVAVKAGTRVEAGQLIGAVGESGFATGPHLHFEIRQGEQAIDPATRLANLDAHATKRALKIRRQQLGS
ncbi:peptidoglycan DD-metalloendopeptidase family protein [Duganella sp. Dugasp56]|uniref:peptidoglycan DD-metalloendopeptidase family protein n=1 Tax=Duganella sp. Dugasp56 TaxID=3243046 RepID=UPI0039AF1B3C